MNKTIQRPLACRNAHCGAMCSPADAIFLGNPKECYKYERRDDLYRQAEILEKVKQAREEIEKYVGMLSDDTVADVNMKSGLGLALEKIDELVESEE